MKSASRIDVVFFCAESKIAVCSVSHRLGSFCCFSVSQSSGKPCDGLEMKVKWCVSAAYGVKRWNSLEMTIKQDQSAEMGVVIWRSQNPLTGVCGLCDDGQVTSVYPGTKALTLTHIFGDAAVRLPMSKIGPRLGVKNATYQTPQSGVDFLCANRHSRVPEINRS